MVPGGPGAAALVLLWWWWSWSWCCGLACGYEAGRGGAWNGRDRFHRYPHPAKGHAAPKEAMVDVVNNLGLRMLSIHNERNENNIAISPYGALAVLVALGEGIQGDAVREIQYAAQLPNDISVIRVGLRDIHRHLKSYFIPKEGFLAGLTLNQDNVTLNPEYEEILRFYGYDVMSFNNAPFPEPAATEGPQKESGVGGTTVTTESAETSSTAAAPTEPATVVAMTIPEEPAADTTTAPVEMTEPTTIAEIVPEEPAADTTTVAATVPEEPAADTTTVAATVPDEETATEVSTTAEAAPASMPAASETETTAAPEEATEVAVAAEGTPESTESTAPATTETTATDPGDATGGVPPMEEATEVVLTESTEAMPSAEPTEEAPAEPTVGDTTPEAPEEVPAEQTEDTPPEEVPAEPTEDTPPEAPEEVPAEPTEDTPPEAPEEVPAEPTEDTPPEAPEEVPAEPTEDTPPEQPSVPEEPEEEASPAPTEDLSVVIPADNSDNDLANEQFGGQTKRKRSENLVELNLIHPIIRNKRRNTRSILDYVVARYYDEYRPDRRWYSPDERPGFLVYGRYREYHVSFMRYDTVLPFYYIPHLDAMALSFPLDNKNYYLLLILPVEDDGIDRLICDLRLNGSLRYIIDNLRERHVVATIPSFSLKGYVVLTPSFQELGVKKIFEPRQADFTPMTKERDIYVRNVEQAITVNIRSYIDPNSLEHQRSLNQYSPVEFKADHPFVYFVMDSKLQIALMTGKIVNPLNSRIR